MVLAETCGVELKQLILAKHGIRQLICQTVLFSGHSFKLNLQKLLFQIPDFNEQRKKLWFFYLELTAQLAGNQLAVTFQQNPCFDGFF